MAYVIFPLLILEVRWMVCEKITQVYIRWQWIVVPNCKNFWFKNCIVFLQLWTTFVCSVWRCACPRLCGPTCTLRAPLVFRARAKPKKRRFPHLQGRVLSPSLARSSSRVPTTSSSHRHRPQTGGENFQQGFCRVQRPPPPLALTRTFLPESGHRAQPLSPPALDTGGGGDIARIHTHI
jgi:hypothetical protein